MIRISASVSSIDGVSEPTPTSSVTPDVYFCPMEAERRRFRSRWF